MLLCLAGLPAYAQMPLDAKVLHAVNRLTYGPAPGDLARVGATGYEAFIRSQLAFEGIEEPESLTKGLAALPTQQMGTVQLFREFGPTADKGGKPGRQQMIEAFDRAENVVLEAARARILRAVLSRRQLYELMVTFWLDVFSIDTKKSLANLWAGSFEREAVRPGAMGRFADLLLTAAMHPAMLIAQDNWKNVYRREGKPGLDTTLATTILRHQSLGPNGPYREADVTALARILTGWRVGASRAGSESGGFFFDAEQHDPGDKVFLGRVVKGTGLAEGTEAIQLLAEHPATAKHISRRLAVYFLCDEPPPALVDRLAKAYLASGGDIRRVLEALFGSPEFFDPKYLGAKLKTPLRQLASALRACGGEPANTAALAGVVAAMGQPLYRAPGPEGYPSTAGPWLTPAGIERRVGLAADLALSRLPAFVDKPAGLTTTGLADTLGTGLSKDARQAADKAPAALGPAVILASPDFMRY